MRWLVFLLLVLLLACGGGSAEAPKPVASSGDPQRAVGLGEWCNVLSRTICIRAGSCIGSIEVATSCNESAVQGCLAGRAEDAPSGHKGGELDACVSTYQNAPCDGYMSAVAAHVECQAR